jgi:hypothetical protein
MAENMKSTKALGWAFAVGGSGILFGLGSVAAGKASAAGKLKDSVVVMGKDAAVVAVERDEAAALQAGNGIGAAFYLSAAVIWFIFIAFATRGYKIGGSRMS